MAGKPHVRYRCKIRYVSKCKFTAALRVPPKCQGASNDSGVSGVVEDVFFSSFSLAIQPICFETRQDIEDIIYIIMQDIQPSAPF